jgi:hypothetical protein
MRLSAGYITNASESNFSVQTRCRQPPRKANSPYLSLLKGIGLRMKLVMLIQSPFLGYQISHRLHRPPAVVAANPG